MALCWFVITLGAELLRNNGKCQFCSFGRTDKLGHEYLIAGKAGTYIAQGRDKHFIDYAVLTHLRQFFFNTLLDTVLQTLRDCIEKIIGYLFFGSLSVEVNESGTTGIIARKSH